jgi:hypothetical protein
VDLDPAALGVVLGLVDDQVRLMLAFDARSGEPGDAPDDVAAVDEVHPERPVREAGLATARVEEVAGQTTVADAVFHRVGERQQVDQLRRGQQEVLAVPAERVHEGLGLDRLRLADRARAGVALVGRGRPAQVVLVVAPAEAASVLVVGRVIPEQLGAVDRVLQHRDDQQVVLVEVPDALADRQPRAPAVLVGQVAEVHEFSALRTASPKASSVPCTIPIMTAVATPAIWRCVMPAPAGPGRPW